MYWKFVNPLAYFKFNFYRVEIQGSNSYRTTLYLHLDGIFTLLRIYFDGGKAREKCAFIASRIFVLSFSRKEIPSSSLPGLMPLMLICKFISMTQFLLILKQ